MQKFKVNRTINHDGDLYADGTIELGSKAAAPLLANGAISEIEKPEKLVNPGDIIVQAITGLDPADDALWTKDGRPDLKHLSELLHRQVTAAERDAAWEIYQQANS